MIALANKKKKERKISNVQFKQIDIFDKKLDGHSFSAIFKFQNCELWGALALRLSERVSFKMVSGRCQILWPTVFRLGLVGSYSSPSTC